MKHSGKRSLSSLMVSGGAGFIGSALIRYLFGRKDFTGRIVNVDKLTYAGNPAGLLEVERSHGDGGSGRYAFERADIADLDRMKEILRRYEVDTVIHLAAETHVDRSIHGPAEFIRTNIVGTFALLEAARDYWQASDGRLFHHVSTDEVYGSLGPEGSFCEETPYDPRSPYSASKAGSDHLVAAYYHTYGLPVTRSNCSNNYGPYQFPEKLIPLMILNMLEGKKLPVYGDGRNVRDWLYVEDHADAIWRIVREGEEGESYNVGGGNEWENIRLVETLCDLVAEETGKSPEGLRALISHVEDRKGHDRRYAINFDKIRSRLGWQPTHDFHAGLAETVRWYLTNPEWVTSVRTGAYRDWIERQYGSL